MAGLYIDSKRDFHLVRWGLLVLIAVIILTTCYYTYDWYVNGAKPPIIPLPATAYADTSISEAAVTQGDIDSYSVAATHPRYISIPALNIKKARIQEVGLTKENILDTPRNISDTAWSNKSALPGQGYGQVVIDGHNGGVSRDGIFVNLNKLNSGDEITIERGDGKQISYRVVKDETMTLDEVNKTGMQQLMQPSDSNKEGLGLITCAGKWIPRDKVFDERILVWAVAE